MEPASNTLNRRILSIDILRGIIMVIMALDHVRDFYGNATFDPLDLTKTSTALFLTRWITHLCAPGFIFLSGISAYLSLSRKTKNEASAFLMKRGCWLLLLEFTVIGFGWLMDIGFHMLFAQVIWAIGCSMIFLSALIFSKLKPVTIGIIGLTIICLHNTLDSVQAASFGTSKIYWMLFHEQGFYQITQNYSIFVAYPIVPWIGVISVGYYFGTLFKLAPEQRKPLFLKVGGLLLFVFLILRASNLYGDPFPWQQQDTWWRTVLAFIKCHKYPPSLLYLLITIGINILALSLLENVNTKISRIFTVYGKVPFFYYVLHIYLIHISQVIIALSMGFTTQDLINAFSGDPGKWGFDLATVYLVWLIVIAILYLPCRWFMKVKERRKDWWLSYI